MDRDRDLLPQHDLAIGGCCSYSPAPTQLNHNHCSILQTPFQCARCLLDHIIPLLCRGQHKQIYPSTVQFVVAFETRLLPPSDNNQFLTQWAACLVLVRIIRIGQWKHNRHCIFTYIYMSTQSTQTHQIPCQLPNNINVFKL